MQISRRIVVLLGLITILVATASPTNAAVLGLDVYAGNGVMNWSSIAADGKTFAFVKATEGAGLGAYLDPQLQNNETNGTAAGMYIGAYDFAHPEDNTPAEEAGTFVAYAEQFNAFSPGHMVPALDMETGGGAHVGASSLSAWCNAWVADVYALTGVHAIIYSYPSFVNDYLDSTVISNPLWIASYDDHNPSSDPTHPTGPWGGAWTFWQYTDVGQVNGDPSANVDLDEYNGSLSAFLSNEVIPVPEPSILPILAVGGFLLSRWRIALTA